MNKRELLCEVGLEDSIVFEDPNFDNAIIGYTDNGNVIYDYNMMIECLMEQDDIDEISSMEFIDYNTIRSLPYADNPKPIIMYRLME